MLTKTRISDGQVTTSAWDYRNRLTIPGKEIGINVTPLFHWSKFDHHARHNSIGALKTAVFPRKKTHPCQFSNWRAGVGCPQPR
jgi:hypothetical protein